MKITGRLADDCPNGYDCPRIHDTDGDEVIVQGDTLTDADLLADLHLPAHESAVVVPRSLIYPQPMDLDDMAQWIAARHTFNLLRLENRSHYTSGSDGGDYHRYLRGEAEPLEGEAWRQAIARDTAAGRHWSKIHVVRGDLTDYERYEFEWGFTRTVAAGEQVRIFETGCDDFLEEVPDFFLVDGEHVVRSIYNEAGRHVGAQVVTGADARVYRGLAEMIWDRSESFASWWDRHPGYHRKPRAA